MDEGLGKDGDSDGKTKSKPKIDIKTTASGKLRAVQEADEEESIVDSSDDDTSAADSEENNGGEE
jgi:ABC-2 type transport system ATP-binding protein